MRGSSGKSLAGRQHAEYDNHCNEGAAIAAVPVVSGSHAAFVLSIAHVQPAAVKFSCHGLQQDIRRNQCVAHGVI